MFWQKLHDAIVAMLHVERRFEPFFRPVVDAVLREPSAALIQYLINLQRRDEGLGIAEEREQPGEEEHLQSIIDTMAEHAPALAAPQLPARRQHQDARCGAWRGDHTRRSARPLPQGCVR